MSVPRVFVSPGSRRHTVLVVLGGLGLFAIGVFIFPDLLPALTDPEAIRHQVLAFGPLAPVAFVLLQAAQVIFAPIPGQVVSVAGGYLFGAVAGTAYSLLGAAIGSYVVFVIARRFGRPYVDSVVVPDLMMRFDEIVEKRGYHALFLVFLVPGLPDDAICFVAGLTDLDIKRMVAVSIAGRAPGYFLVNFAGERFAQHRPGDGLFILGVLLLVSLVVYYRRQEIIERLRY